MKKTISQILSAMLLVAIMLTACSPVNVNIMSEEPAPADVVKSEPTPEMVAPVPVFDFIVHEGACDIAVANAAERAGVDVPTGSWSTQDETPEGLVGSSAFRYTNGPWVVKVSAPVVAPEYLTYTVVVDHMSAIFRWEGTVDADGNVTETAFTQGSMPTQGPATSEESWIGVIVSNPTGAQFDDYFQMMDQNGTRAGIDGETDEIRVQLLSFRDIGQTIQVWGILQRDVPDSYGMQIRVTRVAVY